MSEVRQITKPKPYEVNSELETIQFIGDLFADHFVIDADNSAQIIMLINYFNGHNDYCDPSKGIMLRGNTGTGKTLLMRIFQKYASVVCKKGFKIVQTREVLTKYMTAGMAGIGEYFYNNEPTVTGGTENKAVRICIDDIGSEQFSANFFGNQVNLIQEVIYGRYDIFSYKGIQTHITTNLTPSKIEEAYGERVRSRLTEMMNDIVITGNDRRKQ